MKHLLLKFILAIAVLIPISAQAAERDVGAATERAEYLDCQLLKADGTEFTNQDLGLPEDLPSVTGPFTRYFAISSSRIDHKFVCNTGAEIVTYNADDNSEVYNLLMRLAPLAYIEDDPDEGDHTYQYRSGNGRSNSWSHQDTVTGDDGKDYSVKTKCVARNASGSCTKVKLYVKYGIWLKMATITLNDDGTYTIKIHGKPFVIDSAEIEDVYLKRDEDGNLLICRMVENDEGEEEEVCSEVPDEVIPFIPPSLLPTTCPVDPGPAPAPNGVSVGGTTSMSDCNEQGAQKLH